MEKWYLVGKCVQFGEVSTFQAYLSAYYAMKSHNSPVN